MVVAHVDASRIGVEVLERGVNQLSVMFPLLTPNNLGKNSVSGNSATVGADKASSEDDLQGWLDTCPVPLPASVTAGILAMAKAVKKRNDIEHPVK